VHSPGIPRLFAQSTENAELQGHEDRWDQLDKDDYQFTVETNKALFDAIDPIFFKYCSGRRVLEIGCGAGRFLEYLTRRGQNGAVGADISIGMLRGAARKGMRTLINAPAENLPFLDKRFDVVISTYSSYKYVDRSQDHAEVLRILQPGGYFVFDLLNYWPGVVDHIWWNYLRKGKLPPAKVCNEYTLSYNMRSAREEVRQAERAGFRLVDMLSVRYLPFLRGRLKSLGYWPGYWGAKLGCDTVFVLQKPSTRLQ